MWLLRKRKKKETSVSRKPACGKNAQLCARSTPTSTLFCLFSEKNLSHCLGNRSTCRRCATRTTDPKPERRFLWPIFRSGFSGVLKIYPNKNAREQGPTHSDAPAHRIFRSLANSVDNKKWYRQSGYISKFPPQGRTTFFCVQSGVSSCGSPVR